MAVKTPDRSAPNLVLNKTLLSSSNKTILSNFTAVRDVHLTPTKFYHDTDRINVSLKELVKFLEYLSVKMFNILNNIIKTTEELHHEEHSYNSERNVHKIHRKSLLAFKTK